MSVTTQLYRPLRWAFSVIAIGAAALGLGEVLLRVVNPQPVSAPDVYRRHAKLDLYAPRPNVAETIANGEATWNIFTDQHGYRVASPSGTRSRPPQTVVLVLGGTNTFGYDVDESDTFSGLLATSRPDFYVINAAVPVYGPNEYRRVLGYLLDEGLRPDIVIVGFCPGTDFAHSSASKDIWPTEGYLEDGKSLKAFLKFHSHLYRLAARLLHGATTGTDPRPSEDELRLFDPVAWTEPPLSTQLSIVESDISGMEAAASSHSTRLMFVLVPTAVMVAKERNGVPDLPSVRTEEILRSLRVPEINTTPVLATLPAGTTHFTYDRHLTKMAHRAVAVELEKFLSGCARGTPPQDAGTCPLARK